MQSVSISTNDFLTFLRSNASHFTVQGDSVNATLRLDAAEVVFICKNKEPEVSEIHVSK